MSKYSSQFLQSFRTLADLLYLPRFFISALSQMHDNFGGKNRDCKCPIRTPLPSSVSLFCTRRLMGRRCDPSLDSTFYGKLQSDVRCASCGAISSAVDPMLDISLDLRSKAGVLIEGENSLDKSLTR